MNSNPKILFLTHPYPNLVPDLLLHGLREILGENVVDFPRKDSLYEGRLFGVCPIGDQVPELFKLDEKVDRQDIPAKLKSRYFDIVVADVRALDIVAQLPAENLSRLVLIDGEDAPRFVMPGKHILFRRETNGFDMSIPLPMAMPKQLLQKIKMAQSRNKIYSVGFIGSYGETCKERLSLVEQLKARYKDAHFGANALASDLDPRPSGRLSRQDYYKAMQSCHVTLSLKGAGYDTLRYWENMALSAFHVTQRWPLLIPHSFQEGRHKLSFSNFEELCQTIDGLLSKRIYYSIEETQAHLESFHMTHHRAEYFLYQVMVGFGLR